MTHSVIVCDLCPASAPHERANEAGFRSVRLEGRAALDLCPACFTELTEFLELKKPTRPGAAIEPAAAQHEPAPLHETEPHA